jgi:prolyl-tRNA synthetase
MLQSKLFPKTSKLAPKDATSINHQLLVRAGFMDQLMAGSWTLLPLGLRVVQKIMAIVREEMDAVGGEELALPLLHPKTIWNETGRWDSAREVMYQFKDVHGKEYALSFTHEEIVMDLLRKNIKSYQDLPVSVYQFSTKFRNELRAKSGILRGREFLMKDLYSAHSDEDDLMRYYEKVKEAYRKIFDRIGFNYRVAEASGGVFTDKHTHEFQVLAPSGEDTIFYCDSCDWGANIEVFEQGKEGDPCPSCGEGKQQKATAIEVGNIFPLGTRYAEKMGVTYATASGERKPIWFGSYGIGITRVMGTWVEVSNDNNGIIWNRALSPFDVHLLRVEEQESKRVKEIYEQLQTAGIEVLYDDRNVRAGEKFADSDLIGIPVRLVVSKTTNDKVEWKERSGKKTEIISVQEAIKRLE